MKTVSETVKEIDSKKRQLEQQVDYLNEECAKLNVKGVYSDISLGITKSPGNYSSIWLSHLIV